jgi:glycosyltransferase involved in cell wall biosynthesis
VSQPLARRQRLVSGDLRRMAVDGFCPRPERLYLANVAEEFIPTRALEILKGLGWKVAGNFYPGSPSVKDFAPDVLIYVPTRRPDAIALPPVDQLANVPVLMWALYPDQLTGWDVERNSPGTGLDPLAQVLYRPSAMRLANSNYTKELLAPATGLDDFDVCPLGIDTAAIKQAVGKRQRREAPTAVLWQHRWSSDKNLAGAFEVILYLAGKYPHVTFYLGRENDWQPCYVQSSLRSDHLRFIAAACRYHNVVAVPRFASQRGFWRFLRNVDIGFSTAYHESFGLSMLEQAYAGAACVVPNHAAYAEIHAGAMIVPLQDIAEAIETLLQDPHAWQGVIASSYRNASKYDIEVSSHALSNAARHALHAKRSGSI